MKKIIVIIALLGISIFLYVDKKKDVPQDTIENSRVMAPGEISLAVGETARFSNLSLTFNEFIADYRCPIDVQCIQAGAVVANITLVAPEEERTLNKPSDEIPLEFAEYKISIVNTNPPALSTKIIAPKDYVVTFLVEPMVSGDNI